jgi:hypothetical protein
MNLIEPIVQGYMFNEVTNIMNEKEKVMSGGLPITHLVKSMEFITQTGGGAVRETPLLKQLENFSIPIGLVYVPPQSSHLKYEDNDQERVNDVIPDHIYDKLIDLVSYHPVSKGTRKHKTQTHSKRKTKRSHNSDSESDSDE